MQEKYPKILGMGLVQRSSLSCLLFIIYVNDFFQSNKLFSEAFAKTQMWHQNVRT